MEDVSETGVRHMIREDTIREIADLVKGWRNDVPMTGTECAFGILHHFGLEPEGLDAVEGPGPIRI